jgi:hypothetical protein
MATNALSYWQQLDLLHSQWIEQRRGPTQAKLRLTKPVPAKLPRTNLTVTEASIIGKLQGCVRFPPGHSHKRFIRELTIQSQLSDRGRAYLAFIANRYRRQWKPDMEEMEWIVRWGVWIAA